MIPKKFTETEQLEAAVQQDSKMSMLTAAFLCINKKERIGIGYGFDWIYWNGKYGICNA